MMAGMIPISTALEKTGGAKYIADSIITLLGRTHPTYSLAAILLTSKK
jgi:di/tricarboxylate transporter